MLFGVVVGISKLSNRKQLLAAAGNDASRNNETKAKQYFHITHSYLTHIKIKHTHTQKHKSTKKRK